MSSRFFRKHQKEFLAVLGVLTMITFVFAGTLASCGDPGNRGGQVEGNVATWEYDNTAQTITQDDIIRLTQKRGKIAAFVHALGRETVKTAKANELFSKFPQDNLSKMMQENIDDRTRQTIQALEIAELSDRFINEEIILDKILFAKRAEQLGFVISEKTIFGYINRIRDNFARPYGDRGFIFMTCNPATDAQVNQVIKDLKFNGRGVKKTDLYDAIRFEMLAGVGAGLNTNFNATPIQRWNAFCKFRRKIRVQVFSFPVTDSIADVTGEPSEAQLTAFFNKSKNKYPDPDTADPGFKVRDQVRTEYLMFQWEHYLNEAKKKITDVDIQKYYDEHKDIDFIKKTDPNFSAPGEDVFDENPTFGPVAPEKSPHVSPQLPNENKVQDDKKNTESTDNKKPMSKTSNDDAPTPPKSSNKEKPAPTKPSKADSKTKKPAVDKKSDKTSTNSTKGSATQNKEEKKDVKKQEVKKPAKTEAKSPKTGTKPENKTAEPKTKTTLPRAPEPSDESDSGPTVDVTLKPRAPEPPAQPEDKYQWVKSPEVREKIIDILAVQRAAAAIKKDVDPIYNLLGPLSNQWHRANAQNKTATKPSLAKYAAPQKGITINQTDLMFKKNYSDLPLLSEARFIPQASISNPPGEDGEENRPKLIDRLFSRIANSELGPTIARDADKNVYILWKTEAVKTYVPKLSEFRQQVIREWKIVDGGGKVKSARALALKLAERKASTVKTRGKSLKDYQIEAGSGDAVKETEEFSWLTRVPTDRIKGYKITTVEEIENPGDDLMKKLFNGSIGDVVAGLNENKTIAYVIYLASESQTLEVLQKEFAKDILGSGNQQQRIAVEILIQEKIRENRKQWVEELKKSFKFKLDEEYIEQKNQENSSS